MFVRRSAGERVLFDPKAKKNEGDDGGGGGDDGGTGGGEGDDKPPSPTLVTQEQLARALSKRDGDFQKKLDRQLEGAFAKFGESFVTRIDESLAKLIPPPPDDGGKKRELSKDDLEGHPLVRGMKKQIADAEKRLQEITDREQSQKRTNRDLTLRQKAAQALKAAGITDEDAILLLVDGKKAIRYEDDDGDSIVFDQNGEVVDLESGTKSWAKTEPAKKFLPSRGASGSGHRPGQGTAGGKQPSAGNQSATQTFQSLASALYDGLPQVTGNEDD